MELLFSCLLCKKVRFLAANDSSSTSVSINDKLSVNFRPVVLPNCGKEDAANVSVSDFPLIKRKPYVPKWLRIDFRFGHWFGEFGYTA